MASVESLFLNRSFESLFLRRIVVLDESLFWGFQGGQFTQNNVSISANRCFDSLFWTNRCFESLFLRRIVVLNRCFQGRIVVFLRRFLRISADMSKVAGSPEKVKIKKSVA